jgi:hypothetical protein
MNEFRDKTETTQKHATHTGHTKPFWLGAVLGTVAGTFLAGGVVFLLMQSAGSDPYTSGTQVVGREEGVLFGKGGEDADTLRYTHPRYNFTLEFPKELAVGRFPEGTASETIVFQKAGEKTGFQIFVTPYAEDTITKERLEKDVKGGKVEEPIEVKIGKDGDIRALIFWSEDPIVGRLREVWFIHDGFIYEVTAYSELDEWLGTIMQTWEFEK